MPDVIVVGGGVIGCATAYYLAREGASVTLLERGELAGEASGAAAGLLAALSDEGGNRGAAFQALCLDSLSLYGSLLPELDATGVDVRYRHGGVLHVALDDAEARHLRHRFEAQRALAPNNRWLDSAGIAREEPLVSANATAGLLSPDEHYLDPQRLTLALAEAARRHSATVLTETPVTALVRHRDRLAGVRTLTGALPADHVVLAGGPWTSRLAARLGAHVPVYPVRGQMLSLKGPTPQLGHVIWGAHAYLVPREDGQTYVGATVEDVGYRRRNTNAALTHLRRAAAALVPSLASAPLLRAWSGLRPATPDALPIMGLLPGWQNAWVATGHFRNGILLAPISGQLLAQSILSGSDHPTLGPFSPNRFAE
ncbi:MAG: glycine oxidase ThiO [Dehalococcoidia bacterium]|nr:glycine oxidase ThiO [Dehalococcoidia bacterium]